MKLLLAIDNSEYSVAAIKESGKADHGQQEQPYESSRSWRLCLRRRSNCGMTRAEVSNKSTRNEEPRHCIDSEGK